MGLVSGPPGTAGQGQLEVHLSTALSRATAFPSLDPPLPGRWIMASPETLVLMTPPGYVFAGSEQVTIPGTLRSARGAHLEDPEVVTVAGLDATALRVQEVLADLGYLPVRFTSSRPEATSLSAEIASFTDPPTGTFAWRWGGLPSTLEDLWRPGVYGVVTKGAVLTFEHANGLILNDALTPALVEDLAEARLNEVLDPYPYSYAVVSEHLPEQITISLDGHIALRSAVNTGIDRATPIGTWPIYLRLASQTMVGTYPNGVAYDIPDVRYINYFDGNYGVHAFSRASYGFPQSAGCVELPPAAAARAWRILNYGTLVTVSA